ncbi:MAG: deoxyribose-phosphate aldolase [Thermoplasmata archaeon HGW-Thermoplasmata-1]|nr:MAG: deoxyribose-phosphate aldolase [Thermoplasmata archaeon HGW-Thermoplasmata-1]
MKRSQLAKLIDHSCLKPFAVRADIEKVCAEAAANKFYAVCVNPCWVETAKSILSPKVQKSSSHRVIESRLDRLHRLDDSIDLTNNTDRLQDSKTDVKVVSVVGFPFGASSAEAKICEAKKAIMDGADELDMVINFGLLKSGDFSGVEKEIAAVKRICGRRLLKVIIECCYLTDDEKIKACKIAAKAGADFVKTSTGFGTGGAAVRDVALIKKALEGTGVKIKAAGGIKTYGDALKMIRAGASRIGTSAGVDILKGV